MTQVKIRNTLVSASLSLPKYEGRVYSHCGKDKEISQTVDVVFSTGYANIYPRCTQVPLSHIFLRN